MKKLINFFKNLFKKSPSVDTPVVTVTVTVTAQPKPAPTPKPIIVNSNDDVTNYLLGEGMRFVSEKLMEKDLPNNALIRYDLNTTDLTKTMINSTITVKVGGEVLRAEKFMRKHGK